MRSTYDRSGGNEGADASHFLYQLANDFNVSLDVEGPGVLYFARYNHWHGSPWHYVVDGADHIVEESSTADPLDPAENSVFVPEHLVSKSADVDVVAHSGRRPHLGPDPLRAFLPDGILPDALRNRLLHLPPVCPWGKSVAARFARWDTQSVPDPEVLALIGRAGSDLAPRRRYARRHQLPESRSAMAR
jgi:hypothetical protein